MELKTAKQIFVKTPCMKILQSLLKGHGQTYEQLGGETSIVPTSRKPRILYIKKEYCHLFSSSIIKDIALWM
jgi:hypothetical protein